MKQKIKSLLKKLPLRITKNQKYDYQTKKIIQKVCHPQANTVDVGCHKGEVLDIILNNAPEGNHFGFEPLPDLFEGLQGRYPKNCTFYDYALSDKEGETSFNYVISNPSYSGLQKRRYDKPNEEDTTITVKTKRLDDILPKELKIDFIKIDVEGGEYLVMKGATQTMKKWHPVVVFEHGLGGADCYGIEPKNVYDLIVGECKLKISTLRDWLKEGRSLSQQEFENCFYKGTEYYFIAHP